MPAALFTKMLPILGLVIAHSIWGVNFIVAKVTLQEFPPFSLALLRFAFASLLLAPFFLAEKRKVQIAKDDLPKLIGVGITIITLNITFFFIGISKTTAIDAAVLTLIIPILSVILGWIFLREVVYLVNILGIIVGLLGATLILGLPEILLGNFSAQVLTGNILIILASVAFVIGAIISRQLLKKYSSLTITAIAFMVGTVTFLIPAASEYIQNPGWISKITMLGLLGLVYMTFLSSISAYFLFEWGLARLGVIRADLFQYLEPAIATFLAVVALNETLTVHFLAGTILIVAGVYLGNIAKEFHHRSHKSHRI